MQEERKGVGTPGVRLLKQGGRGRISLPREGMRSWMQEGEQGGAGRDR